VPAAGSLIPRAADASGMFGFGKKKKALTPKQLAQRKYAASMRGVRKRAKKSSGGKGRVSKRAGATKLRRKLGLKAGKK
jgi:hypothetical protein